MARVCEAQLSTSYRNQIGKFPKGPGVFKLDWALDGPIPWKSAICARAGTVHVGGSFEHIATGEACVARGKASFRPFVLVAQQSLFDETRAPAGKHTGWAYCHVPNGSQEDMTLAIEEQIERFAPGFQDRILGRHAMGPAALERYNENYEGGDISGGSNAFPQFFARPRVSLSPYETSHPNIFLCSSSTPPGGGVHGMCGFHAARVALRKVFGKTIADAE
jgi:phytoene dehydrogenase-like protein